MIVAESDVLIDALRGRKPAAARVELEIKLGSLVTTAVNAFELRSGARTVRERRAVEALLGALPILAFDDAAGRAAAEVRLALERAGQGFGMADCLIAGVCLSRSALLLTRDRSHFERVSGLVLATLELS